MSRLPVIVAQGGIGPAGRTSGFMAYQRLVMDCLSQQDQQQTVQSLAALMGLPEVSEPLELADAVREGTLIRPLENFDPKRVTGHKRIKVSGGEIELPSRQVPSPLPAGWDIISEQDGMMKIRLGSVEMLMEQERALTVESAGQLPSGFDPAKRYPSRNHPRGLQMTVFGASDAIQSMGMNWDDITSKLAPDQVSVYAGSSMSQLDYNGNGGMLQARLLGKRVTSKQCPLGFAEMPADFINAYVTGTFGNTGTRMGACATFLYNLQSAVDDIRSGRCRLALVGSSEAPIMPETIDGYSAMGALATVDGLRKLDGIDQGEYPNLRRACRPFSDNCGFTLAESAQFFVLMDDELALETGADILGGVMDVFVNADGNKKSISGPGLGNWFSVAKALESARQLAGNDLQQQLFIQAHGTGTPQNRVTESRLLDQCVERFGMTDVPLTAIKCRLGHSLASAAGDQLMVTLGAWNKGWLPGIDTITGLADDVSSSCLNILQQPLQLDPQQRTLALLNAKGFGGNNATALVAAPSRVAQMLEQRHGKTAMTEWQHRNEQLADSQQAWLDKCSKGEDQPMYRFGENVMDEAHLEWQGTELAVPGYGKSC
ncbi:beta-ketoacyl synthase [Spongorhabdus nitratireducens]